MFVVKTKSGSEYHFTVKDNKMFFTKNFLNEGVVSSINGLEVGKMLEIRFYPLNNQYEQSDMLAYSRSTEIISIE